MSGQQSPRILICTCGAEFVANRNRHGETAKYCSNACRVRFGRFGRAYGTVIPRQYGVAKS